MPKRPHIAFCFTLILMLATQGCDRITQCYDFDAPLACLTFIDRDGANITIQSDERLKQYANMDFLGPQPYDKVLRIYKRDSDGNINTYITSYHSNGQVKQYLEVCNGGACGAYREWHENGALKLEGTVIAGTADVTPEAQRDWQFDNECTVWDDCENLIARFHYCKGSLEGEAVQYYPCGQVKIRTPHCRNAKHGKEEMFFQDGSVMAFAHWVRGELQGPATRYWPSGQIASEELHEGIQLVQAEYFTPNGSLLCKIDLGNGKRVLWNGEKIRELQEYRNGLQDGEVRVFNDRGHLKNLYHAKNRVKHGDEYIYYPATLGTKGDDPDALQPQLLISWREGKIHGTTKTWYPDGTLESQREISSNHKNGIATAWYSDGNVMLMEEYSDDKLLRGEYFKKGSRRPESRIADGDGIATLFDSHGQLLRKISYYHGFVLD